MIAYLVQQIAQRVRPAPRPGTISPADAQVELMMAKHRADARREQAWLKSLFELPAREPERGSG